MNNSNLYGWYACGSCGHKSRDIAPLPFPYPCVNCGSTDGALYFSGEAPPSHQKWWVGELQNYLEKASFKISTLEADAAQYRAERDQLQLDLNEKDRLIDLLRPKEVVDSVTANGDQVKIHADGKIEAQGAPIQPFSFTISAKDVEPPPIQCSPISIDRPAPCSVVVGVKKIVLSIDAEGDSITVKVRGDGNDKS